MKQLCFWARFYQFFEVKIYQKTVHENHVHGPKICIIGYSAPMAFFACSISKFMQKRQTKIIKDRLVFQIFIFSTLIHFLGHFQTNLGENYLKHI